MEIGNSTPAELANLFDLIQRQRREVAATNTDEDAGLLVSLIKLMREIVEFQVWSIQKGKSLSRIPVIAPSNLFSARFTGCWALRGNDPQARS